MKLNWQGSGLITHDMYYLLWARKAFRKVTPGNCLIPSDLSFESMLYQIHSRATGRTILALEVTTLSCMTHSTRRI